MEYLLELLGGVTQDSEQLRYAFLLLVALSIFLLVAGVGFLVSGLTDPVKRRLSMAGAKAGVPGDFRADQPGSMQHTLVTTVESAAKYVLPQKDWERKEIEARLVHAGYRNPNAITIYYGIKTLLALALPLIVLVATRFLPELSDTEVLFYILLAAFTGLMIPNYVLDYQVKKRAKLLRAGFPDALDLLVVCVESGLGLVAAIQRVADELDISHPELAEELALVNTEIRLGVARNEALKNMAERTGLEEVKSMVVVLDQSIRFGTSIADSLRVYAAEFRDKRMQLAEERAAKIGTKLIFPLLFCLWPSFFVVVIGPAILRIVDAFRAI